ncbi:hypothetical protein IE53DRAFT_349019 [Violaceomyces palustris]|uniref:Uncharacterized protein n=1 Tax=Violaceomyces palustris TaxID=1673888 RepID=A0ACD0NP75_9BASI|nr:hypothetical protein IE53DRAFT_349019 [Violaceomyces palustris]
MDDLLDLDWNSNSITTTTTTTTSSSSSSYSHQQQPQAQRQQHQKRTTQSSSSYNFESLTRSINTQSPSPSPRPPSIPTTTSTATNTASSTDDAFSSLLSFPSSSPSSNSNQLGNLTLAERQKRAQQQALKQPDTTASLPNWAVADAGWDTLERPSPPLSSSSTRISSPATNINNPSKVSSTPPPIIPAAAAPTASQHRSSSRLDQVWDFDSLSSPPPPPSQPERPKSNQTKQAPPPRPSDPFDFDSFQVEHGPSQKHHGDDDEDDILGVLARPVQQVPKVSLTGPTPGDFGSRSESAASGGSGSSASAFGSRVPSPASGSRPNLKVAHKPSASPSFSSSPSSSAPSRSTSPPPHIVGMIVEMGFSPLEARKALARTETGLDVQAALDSLLNGGQGGFGGGRSQEEEDHRLAYELQRQEESSGVRDSEDAEMAAYEAKEAGRRWQRRQGPNRAVGRQQYPLPSSDGGAKRSSGTNSPASQGAAASEWQQQADQLYAQAAEVGSTMFNKANAFWNTAKAQAAKALEERNVVKAGSGSVSSQGDPASSGPPPSDPMSASDRARARRWGIGGGVNTSRGKEWEGKPRWMQEAEAAAAAAAEAGDEDGMGGKKAVAGAVEGGFKDSDDEGDDGGVNAKPPTAGASSSSRASTAAVAHVAETKPSQQREPKVVEGDLFGPASSASASVGPQPRPDLRDLRVPPTQSLSEGRKPYASPNRRGGRADGVSVRTTPSSVAPRHREVPADDAGSIQISSKWRSEGNEHFRKGAYGDAESSYTRGLDSLDGASLRRIPLYNNRAHSRLKNGDNANAIKDCDQVLLLIVPPGGGGEAGGGEARIFRPREETPLPDPIRNEVNLRESWAKAVLRRAQAKEAMEKWDSAKRDWEALQRFEKEEGSGKGGAINLRLAADGIQRCVKMVGGGDGGGDAKKQMGASSDRRGAGGAGVGGRGKVAEGRRKAVASPSSSQLESAKSAVEMGLERLRAETAANLAEEAEKLSLKDSVDDRINSWKAGKENNIRALIASVDTIAWDGLAWTKVGMHQLVTDAQVKKAYTRAIAKLHPDKLKAKETTLEQRMIASGAFNVLNEAFNASK